MERIRDQRGVSLVEAALVLPVLVLLLLGIVDGSWLMIRSQLVERAADAATARAAQVAYGTFRCTGGPDAYLIEQVRDAAYKASPLLDRGKLEISVRYVEPACVNRTRHIAVSVSYPLQAYGPVFRSLSGTKRTGGVTQAIEMIPPGWLQAEALTGMSAAVASLTGEYGVLSGRYSSLQGEYGALGRRYSSLQDQYNALSGRYGSLQGAYNDLGNRYDSLQRAYHDLSNRYASLYGRWSSEPLYAYRCWTTTGMWGKRQTQCGYVRVN